MAITVGVPKLEGGRDAERELEEFLRQVARSINGVPVPGGGSTGGMASSADTYITKKAEADLPNAQSLGSLTTGLLKNTVAAGVGTLSPAAAGVDYMLPSATMALPGRTLYVAKSWSAGADATVFFTTITAAVAQALTMAPTAASPVDILIAPGVYAETVSNLPAAGFVNLKTLGAGSGSASVTTDVQITGISWAPSASGTPFVGLAGLNVSTIAVAGANFSAWLSLVNVYCPSVTVDGGANLQASSSLFSAVGVTGGSLAVISTGSFVDTLTVDGTSVADVRGSSYVTLAGAGYTSITRDFGSDDGVGGFMVQPSSGKLFRVVDLSGNPFLSLDPNAPSGVVNDANGDTFLDISPLSYSFGINNVNSGATQAANFYIQAGANTFEQFVSSQDWAPTATQPASSAQWSNTGAGGFVFIPGGPFQVMDGSGNTAMYADPTTFDVVLNHAAVGIHDTAGWLWLASCAGTPDGTPAATHTGRVPVVVDTTAKKLWACFAGTWKYVAFT